MKFLSFNTCPIDKLADAAAATDKLAKNPPEDYQILATYSLMGQPFSGLDLPHGTFVSISLIECSNDESLATASLEMALAGVQTNRVPILDVSPGKGMEMTEKLKL